MKTGPVFKIKYVNQIQYESKERHASKNQVHFGQEVYTFC